MRTKEFEVQKAMLAREILNTDNHELLKEMSKTWHRMKTIMVTDKSCSIENEAPCRYTVSEMEEHLKQSRQDVKAGRCCTQDEMKKRYGV